MNLCAMTVREIRAGKTNFILSVVSVAIAVSVFSASSMVLSSYDQQTDQILAARQSELEEKIDALQLDTERAMSHLGFNITILPAESDPAEWHRVGADTASMSEQAVLELKQSELMTIEALEPILRRKVEWPETRWTIFLSGSGATSAPPSGQIDVGDEIARSLDLYAGATLDLMGRTFNIRRVMRHEGTASDITLTVALDDAQQMLAEPGRISEIRALQCRVAWQDLLRIREEVQAILPGVTVIEKGSEVLTKVTAIRQVELKGSQQIDQERMSRASMRQTLGQTVGLLLPAVLVACVAWVYLLASSNTSRRRVEIGTLRSLGFSVSELRKLFIFRTILVGLLGGVLGLVAAITFFGPISVFMPPLMLGASVLLALLGSLLPLRKAVQSDPADMLRGEQ